MNDYYNFKEEDVFSFKRCVGRKAKKVGGQLVFAYCPYCNGGGHKDLNTFAISLTTGQFECKRSSCSVRGNMITLARDFADTGFSLGNEVSSYYNIGDNRSYKKFKDAHKKIESTDPAVQFMLNRGIPEEITRKYEITTMKYSKKNIDCVVFPFKDESGEMTFYKVRKLDGTEFDGGGKERSLSGNTKKILFGMYQCEDFGTLVITEGQIDSLSLAAAGIKNAVSVPTGKNGFTWRPHCWDWMVKFDELVVFGDNENGNITLADELIKTFPKKVRVCRPVDYLGCKDANEILQKHGKQDLIDAVKKAEAQISLRIKNLCDVEKVDLENMKYYPTHFKSIDDAIGHGFHEGEVIILTGKCGEGKSTFASMIVGRMIQNGLKCFCYSGELPDWMFKTWLDYQLAGTKNLTDAKRNSLDDWYRDKCYIYDNSSLIDESNELFTVMEQAVKILGCKFVLIDNLMTAMEDKPQEDLWRQQSMFLNRLTKFAKGFNVIVLLIAHPKKGNLNDNDSIFGSGDITNRANIVLRYQRNTTNTDESLVMITKNRTTGKLNYDGFPMTYDDESMRICEVGSQCDPFITDSDGFEEFDDDYMEVIPF